MEKSELKTQKDIRQEIEKYVEAYPNADRAVIRNKVIEFLDNERQEAIKWIKYLERHFMKIEKEIMPSDELLEAAKNKGDILNMNRGLAIEKSIQNKEVANWIKHFFNISEEDLK